MYGEKILEMKSLADSTDVPEPSYDIIGRSGDNGGVTGQNQDPTLESCSLRLVLARR